MPEKNKETDNGTDRNNQKFDSIFDEEEQIERKAIHLTNGFLGELTEIMEIIIAIIVMIGFVISVIPMFRDMPGLLENGSEYTFHVFLSHALNLVIGIEFIRMLIRHTPDSVLEVLLFAIARHVILESETSADLLVGVLAICVIFIIRKYFSAKSPYPKFINLSNSSKNEEYEKFD